MRRGKSAPYGIRGLTAAETKTPALFNTFIILNRRSGLIPPRSIFRCSVWISVAMLKLTPTLPRLAMSWRSERISGSSATFGDRVWHSRKTSASENIFRLSRVTARGSSTGRNGSVLALMKTKAPRYVGRVCPRALKSWWRSRSVILGLGTSQRPQSVNQ